MNIPPSSWGPEGLRFDDFSKSKDRHILQIGANIIDQSDSDNYPTAIHQMLVQRPEYGELELFNTVFGDENLPMLSRMTAVSYKLDDSTKAPGIENVWMQPEVWNPHDSSTAGASTSDPNYPTPSTLRLVTYGGCRVELTEGSHLPKPYKDVDFGSSPTNPDPEGIICFKNPKPTSVDPTPAFFDSPVALSGYGTSSFYKYNYQDTSSPSGSKNRYYYGVGAAPNAPASKPRFLGVWLGGLDRDATTYNGAHSISVNPTSSPGEPHLTFVLEYYDGAGFRPYSMMARLNEIDQPNVNTGAPEYSAVGYSSTSWAGTLGWCQFNSGHPDPRTDRFSASGGGVDRAGNHTYPWNAGNSIRASDQVGNVQDGRGGIRVCVPKNSTNAFTYTNPPVAGYYLVDDWSQNLALNDGKPHCVYADPDGVTRPGDSWRGDFSTGGTGDGVMLYNLTKTTTGSDFAVSNPRRRPVILNRPFRTVAELGYVFRDQPFKTLDFWSDKSADAGLLDIFSVRDEPTVVAGRVNPSTAPAPVLQAIIAGTLQNSPSNPVVTISPADSGTAAAAMANYFSSSNPLSGPADLVNLSNPTYTALAANKSFSNKSYGEGALRAISSVTNTRTWNLLIDVIAQSGVFPPNATNLGSSFIVQGERRYWLHVAIDRFTGKVIDLQLESVYE